MHNPVLQRLAGNAFRKLGLSGSATLRDIEEAARRMRIWPDPNRIPPTGWDLPQLGTLDRSQPEIERIVTALRQPQYRLAERVLWYLGDEPIGGAQSANLDDPVAHHDVVIAALHGLSLRDPTFMQVDQWAALIEGLNVVASRVDLCYRLADVEAASGSEIAATPSEAIDAVTHLPALVATELATAAIAAMPRRRMERAVQIGCIVRRAEDNGTAIRRIVEAADDLIGQACEKVGNDLYKQLRMPPLNPAEDYMHNLLIASDMEDLYQERIFPALHLIAALDTGSARLERAESGCSDALLSAALAWEWGGKFIRAEAVLRTAIACCGESTQRPALVETLERVLPHAQSQREIRKDEYHPDATKWANSPYRP